MDKGSGVGYMGRSRGRGRVGHCGWGSSTTANLKIIMLSPHHKTIILRSHHKPQLNDSRIAGWIILLCLSLWYYLIVEYNNLNLIMLNP